MCPQASCARYRILRKLVTKPSMLFSSTRSKASIPPTAVGAAQPSVVNWPWEALRGELLDAQLLALPLCPPEIILNLLVEPALCRRSERNRQPYRHLRADPSAPIQDGRERLTTNPESFCALGHRELQGGQAQSFQDLSRMWRGCQLSGLAS